MDAAEKITLFCFLLQGVCCRDFNISLPETIRALSGSCVEIKCRFEIKGEHDKDLTDTATGAWYKDGTDVNNNKVFNSSDLKSNKFKGIITGNLHEKNCTTVFYNVSTNHNGKYYFRIVSGDLKYTYATNSSTVSVIESPLRPRVSAQQQELQDQQQVLEWSSVSLRCSAETLCSSPPPTLTWSSTPRIPLRESRPQELISDLNFTAAHTHHTLTFTCTVTYRIQESSRTAHTSITLHVQYAPKISNSSSCIFGNVPVRVCEADGNPSPTVQWHLSGRPVSNSSIMWISEERLNSTVLRSFITLHQSLTHTSTLECVANNTHGSQRKLIQLNYSGGSALSSALTGVAVVSLVIVMCFITYSCLRKQNTTLLQTRQGSAVSSSSTNEVAPQNQSESVYANKDVLSSAGVSTANPQSLIYSSIDFNKPNPKSPELESDSSPHVEYAAVRHFSGQGTKVDSEKSEKDLFTDSSQIYAQVKR